MTCLHVTFAVVNFTVIHDITSKDSTFAVGYLYIHEHMAHSSNVNEHMAHSCPGIIHVTHKRMSHLLLYICIYICVYTHICVYIQPIPLEVTFSNAISCEGLFSCKQVSFHICGSLYTYSQSHLR